VKGGKATIGRIIGLWLKKLVKGRAKRSGDFTFFKQINENLNV